ncbi:hypothetical protein GCM10018780_77710 [Streptomyces lanatus]|nr:hypothetical protein GCM10018780_77710 [Streptomyces lanatus]
MMRGRICSVAGEETGTASRPHSVSGEGSEPLLKWWVIEDSAGQQGRAIVPRRLN